MCGHVGVIVPDVHISASQARGNVVIGQLMKFGKKSNVCVFLL